MCEWYLLTTQMVIVEVDIAIAMTAVPAEDEQLPDLLTHLKRQGLA